MTERNCLFVEDRKSMNTDRTVTYAQASVDANHITYIIILVILLIEPMPGILTNQGMSHKASISYHKLRNAQKPSHKPCISPTEECPINLALHCSMNLHILLGLATLLAFLQVLPSLSM
jgi:hypothetical protein